MPTMPMTLLANIPFLLTILEVLIKILTMISMRLVLKKKERKNEGQRPQTISMYRHPRPIFSLCHPYE